MLSEQSRAKQSRSTKVTAQSRWEKVIHTKDVVGHLHEFESNSVAVPGFLGLLSRCQI